MDLSWIAGVLDWVAAHPGWATLVIFVIALCEGVVVAGLIVPGATLLFFAGALVGTGHLELWPSLLAALSGAFVGDSISYWLGRHFGERLRTYWPLRRYPGALAKGDAFFAAHGGKSLFFGRFVGPVRGIIPAIAGMMNMPPRPFLLVNLVSAVLWAPAYLVPGMVFGASLAVAASVSLRLGALLLIGLIGVWAGWWTARHLIAPRLRRTAALIAWRARNWGRVHPVAAQVLSGPRYALRAFSYGAGWIWWSALAALVALTLYQGWWGGPTLLDEAVLAVLMSELDTGLRALFVLPALLLEPQAWGPAWLAGVAWVAWGGRLRVAAVLGLIVPAAALLAVLLGVVSGNWSAATLYRGAPPLAFPSPALAGFTTLVLASGVLATVAYGPLRRPVQVVGVGIPLLAAIGGVVVGDLWLADAVGGLLLGVVIAGLVVLARTASQRRLPERTLPAIVAVVLVAGVAVKAALILPQERERFVAQADPPELTVAEWLEVGPAHPFGRELRWLDGGRRAVDLQWLAEPQMLVERLEDAGWHEPERRLYGALRWLQPEPDVYRMAPLPRWYRGRLPALIRVIPADENQRLVLRLWPAPMTVTDEVASVWLVSLEVERIQSGWPVAAIQSRPVTPGERIRVVQQLLAEEDLRILEPAQPIRILPARALSGDAAR